MKFDKESTTFYVYSDKKYKNTLILTQLPL